MKKSVVFSGSQPSGIPTIANYLGAFQQWNRLQKKYRCIYSIVDMHAFTVPKKAIKIEKMTLNTLALYLSCGINPNKSIIFVQSHVPEHNQLNWLLNCLTYLNELHRMIQFKEKKKKAKTINCGLISYPVLMASDILLYETERVPAGSDQKQHIELCRTLARRFNKIYGKIFIVPKILMPKWGACIMSLLNPKKKMSKSDKNSNNVISLLESFDSVVRKIKRAITDSDQSSAIYYDPKNKPGISNLLEIFRGISKIPIKKIEREFSEKTYSFFKKETSELLVDFLRKIQRRYFYFRNHRSYLIEILRHGAEEARYQASSKLSSVQKLIGFFPRISG